MLFAVTAVASSSVTALTATVAVDAVTVIAASWSLSFDQTLNLRLDCDDVTKFRPRCILMVKCSTESAVWDHGAFHFRTRAVKY